jgi:prophage regulatory protein
MVQQQNSTAILRRKAVEQRTGLSRSTLYLMVKQGAFPAPISLGAKAVGWVESEVEAFLQGRIAASRAAQSPETAAAA